MKAHSRTHMFRERDRRESDSEKESDRERAMDMIINIISIILCIFILNMCEKVAAMRQLVVYSMEFDVFVFHSLFLIRIRIRFVWTLLRETTRIHGYVAMKWRKGENVHSRLQKKCATRYCKNIPCVLGTKKDSIYAHEYARTEPTPVSS